MKKPINVFALAVILLVLTVAGGIFIYQNRINNDEGPSLGSYVNLDTYYLTNATASTSPVTLGTDVNGTASSSVIVSLKNVDLVDINIQQTSAEASAQIWWTYYFSNDGIDWYPQDVNTTSGSVVTHSAGATIHKWTSDTTGAAYKRVTLSDFAGDKLKIEFGGQVATSTLYVEARTKQLMGQ